MDPIIVITPNELKSLISAALREHFTLSNNPTEPVSDTLSLSDAINFLKENGYPTSKGKIYQLTSQGSIPFGKYGNKLVFSRKELLIWASEKICKVKTMIGQSDPTITIRDSANRKILKK